MSDSANSVPEKLSDSNEAVVASVVDTEVSMAVGPRLMCCKLLKRFIKKHCIIKIEYESIRIERIWPE